MRIKRSGAAPPLDKTYPLSRDKIEFFKRNGFCFLEKVLSAEEVEYYRSVVDHAVRARSGNEERPMEEKTFYERAFTQCGHLWSEFPDVKTFTKSPRFANIARRLFDSKHVRLWHDQALYKLPGGDVTEPHQDIAYWPMLDREAGTLWIALSEASINMGSMHFIPGSHNLNIDSWENTIKEGSDILEKLPANLRKKVVAYDLKPGDATFHHGLTIHYTNDNKSDQIRKAMCIIYYPDGVRYDAHCPASDHHCAAGTEHGQPIATKKNPILA